MKTLSCLPTIKTLSEENQIIQFTASTETADRYGDIIRVKGWRLESYLKNPGVLWGHLSNQPPIGRSERVVKDLAQPALVADIRFAQSYDFAVSIFKMIKEGILKAVSVGFLPVEQPNVITDDGGRRTGYEFVSQELLEISVVPIP